MKEWKATIVGLGHSSSVAHRLVDGNTAQYWGANSCVDGPHTNMAVIEIVPPDNPSLDEKWIRGVGIYGRSDCCQCRGQKLKVELFSADGVLKTWTDVDSLGTQYMGGLIAGGVKLNLDDSVALTAVTKIKISRDFSTGDCSGNQMNLCEVQLLPSSIPPPPPNPALPPSPPPAPWLGQLQPVNSANLKAKYDGSTTVRRILDGNTAQHWGSGTCNDGPMTSVATIELTPHPYAESTQGYDKTFHQAKAACESKGLRLCSKAEIMDKNICSGGWVADRVRGYPMADGGDSGCGGATPGWRQITTDVNSLGSAHCCHVEQQSVPTVRGVRIFGRTDCCECRSQKLKVELFTASGAVKTWHDVDAVGTQSSRETFGGGVILGVDEPVDVTKVKITRDFSSGDCSGNQLNICEVQMLALPQQ